MSVRGRGAIVDDAGVDGAIVQSVVQWFRRSARTLPWRRALEGGQARDGALRDPYHALVSEAMLQQTQVSRVVERFEIFVKRFPRVQDLAAANERDVLALWSGLGYYRRARNLHGAARAIVERHGGRVPSGVDDLLALPGVGRYTAGAVSSIAFGSMTPIVDGNVMRVLLRLAARRSDPSDARTIRWAWKRAEALVQAAGGASAKGSDVARRGRIAAFNEGLMELGATVCVAPPALPMCDKCPLRAACAARAQGVQDRIPRAKKIKTPQDRHSAAVVVSDARGRVLLEQRPEQGMWGGLWQCPTLESDKPISTPTLATFAAMRGADVARHAGSFTHKTTHRTVHFEVYAARASLCRRKAGGREWVLAGDVNALGMSSAARRVIAIGLGENITRIRVRGRPIDSTPTAG